MGTRQADAPKYGEFRVSVRAAVWLSSQVSCGVSPLSQLPVESFKVLYVKLVPAQPGPGMPWLDRCSIPQVSYTTIYDDIHMIHCNTSNSPWP